MREHMGLFRGKRIDNGEWVEGSFLQCGEAHRPLDRPDIQFSDCYIVPKTDRDIVRLVGTNTVGLDVWAYHVDPDTVGECTGLRDKNGKLAFEHDITEDQWGRRWIIFGCEGGFGTCRNSEWIRNSPIIWNALADVQNAEWFSNHHKIIGNAIDNHELLKGGEGE